MTENRLIKSSMIPSGSPIRDFAVADVKGRPLVVCADWYSDVSAWDLLGDEWMKRPLAKFDNGAYGIPVYPDFEHVAADVVDGRVLFAAGGQHQGPGLWDLISGDLLSAPSEFHTRSHAVAMTRVDGRTVAVAGGGAPKVWVWDPSDSEVEPWGPSDDEFSEEQEPLELPGHADDMCGLVTGRLDGRTVVVSGGGSTVVVSDLESAGLIHEWSAGAMVQAVALSEIGGRPVVLATTDVGEIRIWDPVDGGSVGNVPTGHGDRISALDAAVVGGRTVAVTGSDDGTARIWDLAGGRQVGSPLAGHGGEIWTVAITPVDGRHVVLTAGRDGIVRVWDPAN
ncbi:WD40 repeat domain-containing protein [Streptomyces sp. NPDC058409]|uniref:WD40 repeat domain-containing protein n=1 Tax=Streptomyces sp. NPDC058409 TaxID=3346484 RepID=UPI0036531767